MQDHPLPFNNFPKKKERKKKILGVPHPPPVLKPVSVKYPMKWAFPAREVKQKEENNEKKGAYVIRKWIWQNQKYKWQENHTTIHHKVGKLSKKVIKQLNNVYNDRPSPEQCMQEDRGYNSCHSPAP